MDTHTHRHTHTDMMKTLPLPCTQEVIIGLSKERPILGDHPKAHILDFMKSGGFHMKSTRFHAGFRLNPPTKLRLCHVFTWNLPDFMKSAWNLAGFRLNPPTKLRLCHVFTWNLPDFMKSAWNLAGFRLNPPTKLRLCHVFTWNLLDFMKSARFHKICQISCEIHQISWNLPDFKRPIARNGKPCVYFC